MGRSTQRHESPRPSDASRPSDKPTPAGVTSAVQQDAATGSDTESSERPVREKLRDTTIAGINQDESDRIMSDDEEKPVLEDEASNGRLSGESQRGRLQRKRSHDELEAEQQDTPLETKHSRKRSRDAGKGSSEIDRRKVSGEAPLEEADETAAADDKPPAAIQTSTPPESANGAVDESIVSPKTKRSREEYLDDTVESVAPLKESTVATHSELVSTSTSQEGVSQPQTKKQRDSETDDVAGDTVSAAASTKTSIPPTRGFANTSTSSPFGAVASSKPSDTEIQAPSSAFASSGFAALSGGQTSGFGSLSASTGGASPFGAIASSKAAANSSSALGAAPTSAISASESKSPFASMSPAAGASPFATASKPSTSGFGGFAAANKPASSTFGGLTGPSAFSSPLSVGASAFASSSSDGAPNIVGLSNKAARPFGAPATDKEEDDEEGEGDDEGSESVKSPLHDADRPDPRFVAQDLETGEENEETVFSCRAKLYNFATSVEEGKKEWKERGVGVLKLNVLAATPSATPSTSAADDDDPEQGLSKQSQLTKKARFVMRADGSHRLVLNSPVKKELKVGDSNGEQPTNGYVFFSGTLDGKATLELLQLKVRKENAEMLWRKVKELQDEM